MLGFPEGGLKRLQPSTQIKAVFKTANMIDLFSRARTTLREIVFKTRYKFLDQNPFNGCCYQIFNYSEH